MLPPALQRIAMDIETGRARVLAEFDGLAQWQADWQPAPGQWSAGEALDHLVRAESVSGRMIAAALKRAGTLPPYPEGIEEFAWAPPTAADEEWVVPAPDIATPAAGQALPALTASMRAQARWTRALLERLAGVDPRACVLPHPILGPMDAAQWCRFAAYHMGVHRRQIGDVRSRLPPR